MGGQEGRWRIYGRFVGLAFHGGFGGPGGFQGDVDQSVDRV
jgi:hypothetical protein